MLISGELWKDMYHIVTEELGPSAVAHICLFLARHTVQISSYHHHSVDPIGGPVA